MPSMRAEALHRFAAGRVGVLQRPAHDLRCAEVQLRTGLVVGERLVDQLQPGAGEQPLGRHARHRLPRELQDAQLALVARREADVAALGGQRHPAVAAGDEARDAQARAGADQADHAIGLRLAAADLVAAIGTHVRQRHRQRGEVVDDQQRGQVELALRLLDGEGPVAIRHAHPVAFDRVGDGHRSMAGLDAGQRVEVGLHHRGEAGVVATGQHGHVLEAARHLLDAETCVGRADVGQQARIGVGLHGSGAFEVHGGGESRARA